MPTHLQILLATHDELAHSVDERIGGVPFRKRRLVKVGVHQVLSNAFGLHLHRACQRNQAIPVHPRNQDFIQWISSLKQLRE